MAQAASVRLFPLHFVLRRLHSLTGLFPVGVFLLEHVFTNAFSLAGPKVYEERIASLQGLPFVVLIELLFIFLPLAFHALYGLFILREGKINVHQYGSGANWRYTLQRITGVLGLAFVIYHVWATRWTSYWTASPMTYSWMENLLADRAKLAFYAVGSTAILFHFANGIWSALIVWGVTVSAASQRLALKFCAALFVALSSVNALILLNFAFPAAQRPAWLGALLQGVRSFLFGTL